MSGSITISIWLFLAILGLAVLAVLDRILIPGTRWFLRRRINRVINDIGAKLSIEIRPFQLTKRQVLIDRLAYDPQVLATIQRYAKENDMPQEVVQKRVIHMAREIVPSFNAYFYFRIGYWVAKKVARMLYRVRVGVLDDTRFNAIDPDATVVFVMNHRSNMDYILVAFLVAERTTLSYAVGEWARIWPLQSLIRAMGAFFVRRKSGDALYRKVLDRYIHMATKEGVCQAVFMEGGLSRDGRLNAPKLGLIDYMLREYDLDNDRDIVFVPVGINYDRTLEDRSLLRRLDPLADKRSTWFVVRTTLKFIGHSLYLMMMSRWRRYGYASVNFGAPVSIKRYSAEAGVDFAKLERKRRFQEVDVLCRSLMGDIAEVVPILPVSLVSTVLLASSQNSMDARAIEEKAGKLQSDLQDIGAPVIDMSHTKRADVIADAVDFLLLRRVVALDDEKKQLVPEQAPVLQYYANSIGHWLGPDWRPARRTDASTDADNLEEPRTEARPK